MLMFEYTREPGEAVPRFPRRPARFRLDHRTYLTYECNAIPNYMIRFRDAGREFQAAVYVGSRATGRTRGLLLSVLDNLKVQPPGLDGGRRNVRLGGTPS